MLQVNGKSRPSIRKCGIYAISEPQLYLNLIWMLRNHTRGIKLGLCELIVNCNKS